MRLLIFIFIMVQAIFAKNYYGIFIGCCSKYKEKSIPPLHAKDDAISISNKLSMMYPEIESYILVEENVTRENVKRVLKKVAKKAKRGDLVYFFYSGHGSSMGDKNSIGISYTDTNLIELMENSGLFIPYNFDFNNILKTAVIGKRDLRKNDGFEYLDKKRG